MRSFYFLFLALILFSCNKKEKRVNENYFNKNHSKENENVIYEVLNQIINDEFKNDSLMFVNGNFRHYEKIYDISLKPIYLQSDKIDKNIPPPPGVAINVRYDSIFLKKDSAYYSYTAKILRGFIFNRNKIKRNLQYINDEQLYNLSKKPSNNYWMEFQKIYGDKCIERLSVPFFNKEQSFCVITISNICDPLNGFGNTAFYKKVKGKWILIRTENNWVN
ncbi:hypothetical protein [Halpernia sp. GG3]